jgi:hypothetical protein
MKFVLPSGLKLQSKLNILKLYWAKCYSEITEPYHESYHGTEASIKQGVREARQVPNLALKLQSKYKSYHESLLPDLTAEGHGSSVLYRQKFLY